MSKTTGHERQQLTRAAHNAVRGKSKTAYSLEKLSLSRFSSPADHHIGKGEKELKEVLDTLGIPYVWQYPIEGYNIDFLVNGNVAVEITTESAHRFRRNPQQLARFKKFAEHDIRTVGVSIRGVESIVQNMDEVIANINIVSRNKSFVGKHRVIRCTFNAFSRFRDEHGKFTAVPMAKRFFCTVEDVNW
ncbi:MAG: hypothetical protein [Edwardsiella phage MSW-3]|nr:MAG: hypothetical protein [Edwardsiella phage MSW-3]